MVEPVRILVVDDSRIYRHFITEVLKRVPDCEVVGSVFSGEKALAFLAEQQVDLVTMDLNMPGLDGVDTVKDIAGMDWSTRLEPMVVMVHDAGAKDAERVIEALSVGASGIVRKPSGTDHEANLAHLSDE